MFKSKDKWLILMSAVGIWASAIGSAYAILNCPAGTSNSLLKGTYSFSFIGGQIDDPDHPVSGSGSFTANGAGLVTATGEINCNTEGEFTSAIVGGCYSVNADGTGFLTLATNPKVCSIPFDAGVDLQISVSGNQVLFASDASGTNFTTGEDVPFAGTANRVSQPSVLPF